MLTAYNIARNALTSPFIGAGELGGALAHGLARTRRGVDDSPHRRDRPRRGGQGARHHAGGADRGLRHAAVRLDRRDGRRRRRRHRRWPIAPPAASGRATRGCCCCGGSRGWRTRRDHRSAPARAQRELVERGVASCGCARERLFGSAPEALAAAARAMVALETNGSPRDVALSVARRAAGRDRHSVGRRAIGGFARRACSTSRRAAASTAMLPALWPPGPYALAAAAVQAIDAIAGRSRRLSTCFVAPGRHGRDARRAPPRCRSRLGSSGVVDVVAARLERARSRRARQRDAALRSVDCARTAPTRCRRSAGAATDRRRSRRAACAESAGRGAGAT